MLTRPRGAEILRPLIYKRLGEPIYKTGYLRGCDKVMFPHSEWCRSLTYLSGVFAVRFQPGWKPPRNGLHFVQLGSGWFMPDLFRSKNKLGLAQYVAGYVCRHGPKVVIDTWGVGFPRTKVPRTFLMRAALIRKRCPNRIRAMRFIFSTEESRAIKMAKKPKNSGRGKTAKARKPRQDSPGARKAAKPRTKARNSSRRKAGDQADSDDGDYESHYSSAPLALSSKMKAALARFEELKALNKRRR